MSALFGLGSYARYYRDNGDAAREKAALTSASAREPSDVLVRALTTTAETNDAEEKIRKLAQAVL